MSTPADFQKETEIRRLLLQNHVLKEYWMKGMHDMNTIAAELRKQQPPPSEVDIGVVLDRISTLERAPQTQPNTPANTPQNNPATPPPQNPESAKADSASANAVPLPQNTSASARNSASANCSACSGVRFSASGSATFRFRKSSSVSAPCSAYSGRASHTCNSRHGRSTQVKLRRKTS